MCECQGNPFARVTLALGLPCLLVNRALVNPAKLSIFGNKFHQTGENESDLVASPPGSSCSKDSYPKSTVEIAIQCIQ